MSDHFLDFEKSVLDVISRRREIEEIAQKGEDHPAVKNITEELDRLAIKEKRVLRRIYRNLEPWQKVQVARHPNRPHAKDYITNLITDFLPLAGDRLFAEDKAMIAGIGKFNGKAVAVLGIEKGRKTKERVEYNFGMPKPEGYRKAKRIMQMADRFNMPLITFVDTPGAFPGIDAEARGQSEAIASCIETSLGLKVPVISVITGEGGSGGALAIAVADRVIMLEHSIYSVISPEGCASILWRDQKEASQAAEALKLTAQDLHKLGIIEEIIKEPVGGAQRDWELTYKRVELALVSHLVALKGVADYPKSRRNRFLAI